MTKAKVYQFNFEKTYKEIEINGKTYRVDFSDDALTEQRKAATRLRDKYNAALENFPDFETATEEQIEKLQADNTTIMKDFIETVLGEGTFEELYEAAGRSANNLTDLVEYLNDMQVAESAEKENRLNKKYGANKKR